MKYKVGDKVIYLEHTHEADPDYFTIGEVYTIRWTSSTTKYCTVDNIDFGVDFYQIKLVVPNNALSRVLYPFYEVCPQNSDYLTPREEDYEI